jgi:hypothetical protein
VCETQNKDKVGAGINKKVCVKVDAKNIVRACVLSPSVIQNCNVKKLAKKLFENMSKVLDVWE